MQTTISSKKAAEFLNVNESTIKRWADNGILKCFKTPGGHRKFIIEDLKKLAGEHNIETSILKLKLKLNSSESNSKLQFHIYNRDYDFLNKEFEKILLKGETESAFSLIYNLYLNGYSLENIFDLLIKVTMKNIGLKWSLKKLNIESEHIATNAVLTCLHQLEKVINRKHKNGKTAICAGLENEHHEVGLLCVKISLEANGWNVIYPGINLPFKSLSVLNKKFKPDILCITSASSSKDTNQIKRQLIDLKKSTKLFGTKLLLGGNSDLSKKKNNLYYNSITELNNYLKFNE